MGNECIVLDEDLEVVCCHNVSHHAGNMPAIWYVWFRVYSHGIRRYVSLGLVIFWSILTHMFCVVFMYMDVHDDIIMDHKSS